MLLAAAPASIWREDSATTTSPASAGDKQLSVYSPRSFYALVIFERGKVEYVDLTELLDPVAPPVTKVHGNSYEIRVKNTTAHFLIGERKARIGQHEIDLGADLLEEKGHILLPADSIPAVVQALLQIKAEYHAVGQRLFLGDSAISFSTQLRKEEGGALLLKFPVRADPRITVDGGHMQLVFTHEPIVSGEDRMLFDDKLISAMAFSENNGSATIKVEGKLPLLASFADEGKTIVISAAPAPSASSKLPTAAVPITTTSTVPATSITENTEVNFPKPAVPSMTPGKTAIAAATAQHFLVVIDPSHGGTDPGARFHDNLLEKDITLSVSRHLRTELQNRGISSVLLRENDTAVSFEQRATTSNMQRASIYISIHATETGHGARVYTALLPMASDDAKLKRSAFLPWQTAHAGFLERSRTFAGVLVSELAAKKIAAVNLTAAVAPLNTIAAPAIAIEIAPRGSDSGDLTTTSYQQAIAQATAIAITSSRSKIEEVR